MGMSAEDVVIVPHAAWHVLSTSLYVSKCMNMIDVSNVEHFLALLF